MHQRGVEGTFGDTLHIVMTMVRSAHPVGFARWQPPAGSSLPVLGYTVVRTYPHDRDAFTQGLVFLDGFLYEGTGLNGRSSIRKVKLETGEVVQRRDVIAPRLDRKSTRLNSSHLSQSRMPSSA